MPGPFAPTELDGGAFGLNIDELSPPTKLLAAPPRMPPTTDHGLAAASSSEISLCVLLAAVPAPVAASLAAVAGLNSSPGAEAIIFEAFRKFSRPTSKPFSVIPS